MKLYNSLSRQIEEFIPNNPTNVTMYACGPTVYDFQHIGNLRTATLMDLLKRVLQANKFQVKTVMNITDVEDKIEKRASELNVSVDSITSKYEKIYMNQLLLLNISADIYPRATDHIAEQIELIQALEEKGYAYKTDYGIYFDTLKDSDYGKLGNTFKSDKAQSRIELTEGKKQIEDFALWKFVQKGETRQKTWGSPWGVGFPGWHIECSAMSIKTLSNAFVKPLPTSQVGSTFETVATEQHRTSGVRKGFDENKFETIDIHLGGEDLKEVHHENEMAQSESVTGKAFIKYWVHGGMLNIEDTKMSKSLGNFITLQTIIDQGFEPMVLRYFYYFAHYRSELKFSWESLKSAKTALQNLSEYIDYDLDLTGIEQNMYSTAFLEKLNDDLNVPQALAVLFELIKSNELDENDKKKIVTYAFEILGLKPIENLTGLEDVGYEVRDLVNKREELRIKSNFVEADKIRDTIKQMGFEILDGEEIKLRKL